MILFSVNFLMFYLKSWKDYKITMQNKLIKCIKNMIKISLVAYSK